MYCRACGVEMPYEASFCPACGSGQEGKEQKRGIDTTWIIAALIFLPPLGFILIWTSSRWSDSAKYAVTGLVLPQLWAHFLWRQTWSLWTRLTSVILFFLLVLAVIFGLEGPTVGEIATVLSVPLLAWVLSSKSAEERKLPVAGLGEAISTKLDLCHDLIAELESDQVTHALPVRSGEWDAYMRALQLREEGARLYEVATTRRDLMAADERVTRALEGLTTLREQLGEA